MEIAGKIIAVLPPLGGVSQRTGQPWASQQFVVQTDERFPQKLLFKVFGQDKLQQWNIQMGEMLTVQFSVDAHENNGRWYGENNAYNVVRGQMMQQQGMPMQQGYQQQMQQVYQQQQYQQMQPMQQPGASPFPPHQAAPAPQAPAVQQAQQGALPFPPPAQ